MAPMSRSVLARSCRLLVALACLTAAPRAQTFDPARHLPSGPLAVFDCAGVDAWADGLGDGWTGRLLDHPRTALALRGFTDSIRRMAMQYGAAAWLATGLEPGELRAQLGGRLVVALYDVDVRSGVPSLAVVLEGRGHGAVLAAGLQNVLKQQGADWQPVAGVPGAQQTGGPGGLTITVAELGDALVVTVGELFGEIVALRAAGDGADSLGASPLARQLDEELGLPRPGVLAAVDGAAIVRVLRAAADGRDAEELEEFLALSGVGRVGLAGLSVGFGAQGELQQRSVLRLIGAPPARGDVLGTLFDGLATPVPADVLGEALALLPAAAHSVGAARVDLAGMLADVEAFVRAHVPDAGPQIDDMWAEVERELGIDRERIHALPPLTMVSAGVAPAAGGLLPDSLTLVRDVELDPWWQLLEDGLARFEVGLRDVDLGDGVVLRGIDWLGANPGPTLLERMVAEELGGMSERTAEDQRTMGLLSTSLALPVSNVTRSSLGGGWSAVGTLPQALERYVRSRGEPRLPGSELGDMAAERLPGHVSAMVLADEPWAPAIWNTTLGVTGSLQPALGLLGIDGALLPPAELVPPGRSAPGWMTLDVTSTRLSVRGSGAAAGPLLLGAGAGAGAAVFLLAGVRREAEFLVPDGVWDEEPSWDAMLVEHEAQMRSLHNELVTYALAHDGDFPTPQGPVGALQALIDAAPPGHFGPADFVSPIGYEYETFSDDEERPQLDFYTCSWRLVPWQMALGDGGLLFFDAKPFVDGVRRHACMVDGTVQVLDEEDFQHLLRAERARMAQR